MKKIFSLTIMAKVASVLCCFVLASFLVVGGDSFTISVNDKQVVKYYVFSKDPLPSLMVNANSQDQFSVFYSECGKIGTARTLSIRDEKGTVLREWKFADSLNEHTPMVIKAKEFTSKGENLSLNYSSSQVTKPQKLANLILNNTSSRASQ